MKTLNKISSFLTKPSLTPFQFLLLAILFMATAGSLSFAWTGPASSPPNGNVSAPINTGSASQVKNGSLGVDALAVYGNTGISGSITANGVGTIRDANGGWVRTYGNSGWYNQSYGGGWYMSDTTWIRAYSNKNVYTGGQIRGQGGLCIGNDCRTSWPSGGISAVTTRSCSDSGGDCTVSCPSGYYRTGCGAHAPEWHKAANTRPSGSRGCRGTVHRGEVVTYAYCAK